MKNSAKKVMAISLAALACGVAATAMACGGSQDGEGTIGGSNGGWDNRDAVQGYYIQTEFTDAEWEEARSLFTYHPNYEQSCIAWNELILRNNEYAVRDACDYVYEPGQRYELTKSFRDLYTGLYFWSTFYGTYTFEGDTVTLSEPERFSFMFEPGAGRPNAAVIGDAGYMLDASNEYVDNFNGSIINYRHNYGHEAMTVTIDQENFTFKINVAAEE